MKVALFNTFPYGGAATAVKRLHYRLRERGVDSQFYFHRNEHTVIDDASFHSLQFEPSPHAGLGGALKRRAEKKRHKAICSHYNRHIAGRADGLETFSMAELASPNAFDWNAIDADVVHLNWVSYFVDYPSFFSQLPDSIPIVWTLHDMNAFTGGCHYSSHCTRFQTGCGNCSQVINPEPADVSWRSFDAKHQSLKNKQIHVVTPSNWLRELAEKSPIWPEETTFETIRYGLDLDVFRSIRKQEAREKLGISSDAVLIGFGAEDINNRRKGLPHLIPALSRLATGTSVECVVFGAGKIKSDLPLPRVHHFGYVDSESRQSLIYAAADVVVVPSLEDNSPQVGLEAMACGTPVVGFDAGGIPEYVRDGVNGRIAKLGCSDDLACKIAWMVEHPAERIEMGKRARSMMETEFEADIQTQKHQLLYESVCRDRQFAELG